MSTLEIRKEIVDFINNEDETSLKKLYKLIADYKQQRHLDKMIAEGEEDIKTGKTYSLKDARKMIS